MKAFSLISKCAERSELPALRAAPAVPSRSAPHDLAPQPPPGSLRTAAGPGLLRRDGARFLRPARTDHTAHRLAGETAGTVDAGQVTDRDNAHQALGAV